VRAYLLLLKHGAKRVGRRGPRALGLAEAELAEGRADVGHEGAAKWVCDGVTTGKLLDGV
jgi:hypothetical protein